MNSCEYYLKYNNPQKFNEADLRNNITNKHLNVCHSRPRVHIRILDF